MKRLLDPSVQQALANNSLWKNKIENDCRNQNVFLAIRNNTIDFYHKGGRLFSFENNDLKTHIKYASVIPSNGKDYLTAKQLANYKPASNFYTNYDRIKENCSKFSGIEASGVSEIYHKHSYFSNSNVVVLDIEISFASFTPGRSRDIVDILLYEKDSGKLQFVEAKHFSNKEIWSNTTPDVINQIGRYASQISNRKQYIVQEYTKYVNALNRLFNLNLNSPSDINDEVILLIFGFDNDQKNGRLKKLILNNPQYDGKKVYPIGNISQISPENLWKSKIL